MWMELPLAVEVFVVQRSRSPHNCSRSLYHDLRQESEKAETAFRAFVEHECRDEKKASVDAEDHSAQADQRGVGDGLAGE